MAVSQKRQASCRLKSVRNYGAAFFGPLLYVYAVLWTAALVLNPSANSFFASPTVTSATSGPLALLVLIFLTSAIPGLIILGRRFEKVLRGRRILMFPSNRLGKVGFFVMGILFFCWFNLTVTIAVDFLDPGFLLATTNIPSVPTAIGALFTAGPIEETWRWASICALYYAGSKLFRPGWQRYWLLGVVVLNCMAFGYAHEGQYPHHFLLTWILLSIMGYILFLGAVWSGSFWFAVIGHSVYDLIVALPFTSRLVTPTSWLAMGALWCVFGYLYFRWAKGRKFAVASDNGEIANQGS